MGKERAANSSPEHLHWTTSNLGEVMPGIQSPLSFTVWQEAMDWASHNNAFELGAMSAKEVPARFPVPLESPLLRQFYGRVAFQVEYFTLFGDRMPGTSGQEVCKSILGRVPTDIEFRPTARRYPTVAWRYPKVFLQNPSRVRREAESNRLWYYGHLDAVPGLDRAAAVRAFLEATDRLQRAVSLQALTLLGSIQPMWQAIEAVVERTSIADTGVFSGTGGAEANLVRDIWRASRGQLSIDDVRRRHGFHGPVEGELSCHTWREDPAPLENLIQRYAAKSDDADPIALEARSNRARLDATREVLSKTPRHKRPGTRLLLSLAATRMPLRGIAKESFLEAFDGARAAARRLGDLLFEEGILADREDVFWLHKDELVSGQADVDIDGRRHEFAEYRDLVLPTEWKGTPSPLPTQVETGTEPRREVTGVGVSDGIVEGIARVILEPDFSDVEEGEILISPFTDPGWASIMFVSAALVVDIGGALSHAAVVARELGIPCVVNTGDGTRAINTGDRVRVDGHAGTVTVL